MATPASLSFSDAAQQRLERRAVGVLRFRVYGRLAQGEQVAIKEIFVEHSCDSGGRPRHILTST
jgi:hypothetical protein